MTNILVCYAAHAAYYEISGAKISILKNCTIVIIGVYRPSDK